MSEPRELPDAKTVAQVILEEMGEWSEGTLAEYLERVVYEPARRQRDAVTRKAAFWKQEAENAIAFSTLVQQERDAAQAALREAMTVQEKAMHWGEMFLSGTEGERAQLINANREVLDRWRRALRRTHT